MIGDGRETYSYSTLKSMRKEELISVIRCLEKNLINAHEMNNNQFKLLMEKDKYAWHDLTKVPEDLPNEKGLYYCKVGSKHFPYRTMMYVPNEFKREGENKWFDHERFYVFDHFVEAWCEVKTF